MSKGVPGVGALQVSIMQEKGIAYVDDAIARGQPFYIQLAPVAPHDQARPCRPGFTAFSFRPRNL